MRSNVGVRPGRTLRAASIAACVAVGVLPVLSAGASATGTGAKAGQVLTGGSVSVVPSGPTISPFLSLSPSVGPPGTSLTVKGTNFGHGEKVEVYFDTTYLTSGSTFASGSFSVRVTVPISATPGAHQITAKGRRSGRSAQSPFTVQTNWPQFRDGPAHRGYNTTENVLGVSNVAGMTLSWTAATASTASPAVANGVVYIGSYDYGGVLAFNASTGAPLWSDTGGDVVFSDPAVANGLVYVGSYDRNLDAYDASTGTPVWSYKTGGDVHSPAVANGMVYVGSDDHKLYALNGTTGARLWSYTTGKQVDSCPAVANGVVYVGSFDGKLYALKASTGAALWSIRGFGGGSPAVDNGIDFIGSSRGGVYGVSALNASTGALLWSYTTGGPVESSPAVANGVVYVGSDNHNVYALNESTGALVWSYTTGDEVSSSPAVANGIVYVGSWDHNMYGLNASTGSLLWSYNMGYDVLSSPAVADGVVYVASYDGNLDAFGLAGASTAIAQSDPPPLDPNAHRNTTASR